MSKEKPKEKYVLVCVYCGWLKIDRHDKDCPVVKAKQILGERGGE